MPASVLKSRGWADVSERFHGPANLQFAQIAAASFVPEDRNEQKRNQSWNGDETGYNGERRDQSQNCQALSDHSAHFAATGDPTGGATA